MNKTAGHEKNGAGGQGISPHLQTRLEEYFDRLWPLPRSITGNGFRQSLDILSEIIPFERHRFPTDTVVFDWTVPKEWVAREAYFIDPAGKRRCDFAENNLHLLNYSTPFNGNVTLDELKKHLFSLPDLPEAIPYLTSYYEERWGFCISHDELTSLPEGDYQVVIDTEFIDGHLEIGEAVLEGEEPSEILFSTYLCHPSLANNELSGPLVAAFLYERLQSLPRRRHTCRFVVVPETIGTIAFLSLRGEHLLDKMAAGFQITCVGDGGSLTYKSSRRGDTLADRAAKLALASRADVRWRSFNPAIGSDERQYCSPGFDLPMGSLMRTMYTEYPQYHCSLDNKDIIDFGAMAETIDAYVDLFEIIEANRTWKNTVMFGEPQLSKRNLFRSLGSQIHSEERDNAIWWLLNLADGKHDLIDIAEKSGLDWRLLAEVAEMLNKSELLAPFEAERTPR